jgi:glycosyltransferase involved in cell wall biosynthesis
VRIAFDGRWNYHGGVGVYVSTVLEALTEAAAKQRGVEVVAYENPGRPIAHSYPNLRKIQLTAACYSPRAQYELAVRAENDHIDIFHTPFYLAPFFVKCPTLITIHDVIPFLFPIYGRLHGAVVRAGYRASAKRATHILTVSDRTRQDVIEVLKVNPAKVSRVYCGIRHRIFHPADTTSEADYLLQRFGIEKPYVLLLSTSNWKTKNLAAALAAIEEARDKGCVPFQTVITGSPIGLDRSGWRGRLRNAVATGYVETEDMAKLYRNAALFISLSRYEGFGFQIAEGMATGTPCIASTEGSLPEIAGDGAVICSPQDLSAVADTIVVLLADPERRKALSEKALKRAAQFSFANLGEELLQLYCRIAAGAPRG